MLNKITGEFRIVFLVSASHRVFEMLVDAVFNALTILTISDSEDEVTTAEERQNTFTRMMEVALEIA